jgi:outer membrane lipoprotein SlyB
MKNIMIFGLLAALMFTPACGPKRPVVYPDEKVQEVGEEKVRADVEDCIRQAKEARSGTSKTGTMAKSTAIGAAAGAAIGAAAGAFGGGAASGAAQGAAGGGVAGLIGGLLQTHDLDPNQKQSVEECLRQKGYTNIGWR